MELVQLEHFVVLAEQLHFRRAATVAGVSASTLSRQINELERDIDTRLFERNRRQVRLTPAGQAFLADAQATLHRLRFAAIDARRIGRGEQERLRIAHGDAIAVQLLQVALPRLRAAHPEVRLQLVEGPSARMLEAVAAREVDLALIRPPIHDAGVEGQHLCDETMVVAVPSTHRLGARRRIRLADLAGEPLVVPQRSMSPGDYDAVMAAFAAARVPPDIAEEATTTVSLLLMVGAGLGVALVPASSARHTDLDGVTFAQLSGGPAMVALHAAWRGGEDAATVLATLDEVRRAVVTCAERPDRIVRPAPGLAAVRPRRRGAGG